MFRGHNNIVCRSDFAIFCTRMDFTKMFVISLDFAEVKNKENMSKEKTHGMYLVIQLLYFDFFSYKIIHKNKS